MHAEKWLGWVSHAGSNAAGNKQHEEQDTSGQLRYGKVMPEPRGSPLAPSELPGNDSQTPRIERGSTVIVLCNLSENNSYQ